MKHETKREMNLETAYAMVKALYKKLTFKQLVVHLMINLTISERLAKEYLKIIFYQLDIEKGDLKK